MSSQSATGSGNAL
jgi:hypothetical protein